MFFLRALLSLTTFLILVFFTSFGNSEENPLEFVWFPDPTNEEGSIIQANLYPCVEFCVLVKASDVHLLLYTGNNPDTPDELFAGDVAALDNSHFIRGQPLKILIHGFGGYYKNVFPWETLQEFLAMDANQNVILVDWSALVKKPFYCDAVKNTQLASRVTADLIDFLVAQGAVNREDIHVVGFSLGGQVAGQIGSRVSEKLTRITALDPAFPLFDIASLDDRVDPSDAKFVEVIHTSILLGFDSPVGTVDFYPNGGIFQPGCRFDIKAGRCAHSRAPTLFKESLRSSVGFYGVACSSWSEYEKGNCDDNPKALMGYHTPEDTTGTFYLATNDVSPYARGG